MQGASHMLLEEPVRLASVLSPAKPVSAAAAASISLCISSPPAPDGSRALCAPCASARAHRARWSARTASCGCGESFGWFGRSVGWIRFGARGGGQSAGFTEFGAVQFLSDACD